MRDHSSRKYNKKTVTRFATKATFRADGPQNRMRDQGHLQGERLKKAQEKYGKNNVA
jgi:hypothetical protein